MREFEAVVIGGGCAGCSAAFFLKYYSLGKEIRSLLIERLEGAKFSRYHRMCGEAISKRAFREIAPIKPTSILNQIKKIEERWPGGVRVREKAKGYILDRPRFLEEVLKKYERLGGERVTDTVMQIAPNNDHFLLKCSSGEVVRTKFLIGADGAHSVLRRSLFNEVPPRTFELEQLVVNKRAAEDTIRFIHDERYQGSYRWEFPYGELTKIGFPRGVDPEEDKVIERHRRDLPVGGLSKIVAGNACLVGDAAAQANPLTAGGIRISMVAGKRAARAVVAKDLNQYEGWWQSSKFSSSELLIALRHLEKLNNEDLAKIFRPLAEGIPSLSYLKAERSMPEFKDLYSAYSMAGKYGW